MVCLSDTFTIDFTIKLLKIPHFSYHIQIPLIQQSFSSYHDKRSEEHILSLDEIIQNSLMKCQLSHLSYFNFSLSCKSIILVPKTRAPLPFISIYGKLYEILRIV